MLGWVRIINEIEEHEIGDVSGRMFSHFRINYSTAFFVNNPLIYLNILHKLLFLISLQFGCFSFSSDCYSFARVPTVQSVQEAERKKMMKAWSFWKWCERQEKLPTGKAIAIPTKIHTICIWAWAKCYLWHLETFQHEIALESSCTLLSRCDQSRANAQRGNGMFTIKLMHVQIIL